MRQVARRPPHLILRGTVYAVRFRIPSDIAAQVGVVELQRTLSTKNFQLAVRRALHATIWFRDTIERLRQMKRNTRESLERAANDYFDALRAQVELRDGLPSLDLELACNEQVCWTEEGIRELELQCSTFEFDRQVGLSADALIVAAGLSDRGDPEVQRLARKLVVRARSEALKFYLHELESPLSLYQPEDELFAGGGQSSPLLDTPVQTRGRSNLAMPGVTLEIAHAHFLDVMAKSNNGESHIEESSRLVRWIMEVFGADRIVKSISFEDWRGFVENLYRMRIVRGRAVSFADRLTDVQSDQVKFATVKKNLTILRSFLEVCKDRGWSEIGPDAAKPSYRPKNQHKATPEAFSTGELQRLFKTPLFAGYKSLHRTMEPGELMVREDHWWGYVLLAFTGLRAGEMCQLQVGDFDVDAEVPHLKVRSIDAEGKVSKSTKTKTSVRDVPIHPSLFTLGLREFLKAKGRRPTTRVFEAFRLGTKGKRSEGAARYYGDYLRKFDLWSEGRGTHVWRHTVVKTLRDNRVSDSEIAWLVGHGASPDSSQFKAGKLQTSEYGGKTGLHIVREIVDRLDYGFDLVEALGGPYDPSKHSLRAAERRPVLKRAYTRRTLAANVGTRSDESAGVIDSDELPDVRAPAVLVGS